MKRVLGMLMAMVLLLGCLSDGLAEDSVTDSSTEVIPHERYQYSELQDSVSGVVFGDEFTCVYTSEDYILLDKQWKVVLYHKLKHPKIRKNAPYINQMIYQDNCFYFLVFDDLAEKSYIVVQEDVGKPKYGELQGGVRSFGLIDGDYFVIETIDESEYCYGRYTKTGKCVWKKTVETGDYYIDQVVTADDKIYVVAHNQKNAIVQVTVLSHDGRFLMQRGCPIGEAMTGDSTHIEIRTVKATADSIVVIGNYISNINDDGKKNMVIVQTAKDLKAMDARISNTYRSAYAATTREEQTYILAETDAYALYIINMDETVNVLFSERWEAMSAIAQADNGIIVVPERESDYDEVKEKWIHTAILHVIEEDSFYE